MITAVFPGVAFYQVPSFLRGAVKEERMGVDIAGWIEIKVAPFWFMTVKIRSLVGRDYAMFGSLFGVMNKYDFEPVAHGRGLPPDLSIDLRSEINGEFSPDLFSYEAVIKVFEERKDLHAATWITWKEILSIDWDECSKKLDDRTHRYCRDSFDEYVFAGFGPDITFFLPTYTGDEGAVQEGMYWTKGDWDEAMWQDSGYSDDDIFRAERIRRGQLLGDDWKLVFEIMGALARRCGDEGVRLVVWFSS